jgi:hypothetical protein
MPIPSTQHFDQTAIALTHKVLRYKFWVLGFLCLVFINALWGASKLSFSNDYRVFFSSDNPELEEYQQFQSVYGQTDSIILIVHNPHGSVMLGTIIPDIQYLVEQLLEVNYVQRVEAITNFPHVFVENDELIVQSFIHDSFSMSAEDYLQKQQEALSNTIIKGGLLSSTADTTTLNIVFDLPQKSASEVLNAADAVRRLTREFQTNHPKLKTALSGVIMLNTAFSEAGIHDMIYLLPLMLIVLFVILYFLLRSIYGVLIIFAVIAYSCIFALGMAGFFGIPITVVSVSALIIIMTLAVANSMHLLITLLNLLAKEQHPNKHECVFESVKQNFLPICLTSITTIISFLTLNFSDVPPYWHLGNITALGVFAAWVLSFLLLPILMLGVPVAHRSVTFSQQQEARIMRIGHWVVHHHKAILVVGIVACIALVAQIPKLQFNDQFIHYFSKNIEFRRDADFMQQHLSGLYTIEYLVPAQFADGVFEPEYVQQLDAFTVWLRKQQEVGHVYSYSDVMRLIHKVMNSTLDLPEDADTAAQYFLLYQLSLADDTSLESRISLDKTSTRLSVTVDNLSSVEMQSLVERAELWQKQHWPLYMQANATGPAVMFAYISKRNIASMIKGNAVSLLLISLILLVLLRSFSLGVLSLLANALPILMMFGMWTMCVGEVGMVGTTISAATLGIVVDDTIHFLTKYLRARALYDATEAVLLTFKKVGVAIVSTSIVLIGGLAVLIGSDFQLNQQAGLLTVICIGLALLFDLLILPAGLILFSKNRSKKSALSLFLK